MSNDASNDIEDRAAQNMSAYDYGFTYVSQSEFGIDTDTFGTDEQDAVSKLYRICHENFPKDDNQEQNMHDSQKKMRKATLENAWSLIRRWLKKNRNPDDRSKAACYQGHFSRTALHLCCKCPGTPVDIIYDLIDCFPQTVQWPDNQGWLPLHHACAYGLSGAVLKLLCDSYTEGKIIQDKKGRTPLHFLFYRKDQEEDIHEDDDADGSQNNLSMRGLVDLLADSGAYSIPDESGLIPIHYACAYGTSHTVLNALLRYDPTSIYASEKNSRTPIHYAMSNAQQSASPIVLDFLLKVGGKEILNKRDKDQNLPLHLLVSASKSCPDIDRRHNVIECVKVFLSSEPKVDAEIFSSIQSLPTWLRDHAVIHPHMQKIMNQKVSKPFHSCLFMLDLVFHILLILGFEISTYVSIDCLDFYDQSNDEESRTCDIHEGSWAKYFILFSGLWFLLREFMQMTVKLNLGKSKSFFTDYSNYLDIIAIITSLVYFSILPSIEEGTQDMTVEYFATAISVLKLLYYLNVFRFLSSFNKTFAVFVSGFVYVLTQLVPFLIMLGVVLTCFSFAFTFLTSGTKMCTTNGSFEKLQDTCNLKTSLLKMISMMMGETGGFLPYEAKFTQDMDSIKTFFELYYMFYAIIVVIVLSNMLIAITTESYGFINERAVMVFWSNLLDQVAETDNVSTLARKIFRCEKAKTIKLVGPTTVQEIPGAQGEVNGGSHGHETYSGFQLLLHDFWEELCGVFKDETGASSSSYFSCDFLLVIFTRILAVIIILVWFALGIFPFFTTLWPPQLREKAFGQELKSTSNNTIDAVLWEEFDSFKENLEVAQKRLNENMKIDRAEIDELNFEVFDVRKNVVEDMIQVKEIMTSLLETMKNKLERKNM